MKDKKILFITGIVLLFLMTVGMSYAYFSASVSGNADAKDMVVEAGTLRLTYTDSPEIIMQNIKPGQTITKKVTVKNTGTLDTAYNLVWQELYNKIDRNDLVISYTCERLNSSGTVDGTCAGLTETPVKTKTITKNIPIESGVTHNYTITITFKETGENQNYNQGKSFSGVLGIEEYKDNTPSPIYCTFDGNMVQGAEYINGQYTYRYKQEYQGDLTSGTLSWTDITDDGWGVILTDKTSTDAITTTPCTYINDKPVISMSFMFIGSNASSIDLSKANTRNVTNMEYMFEGCNATAIDVSNFDTSNVISMDSMFYGSEATTIDVSSFDTSNVTNMSYMFGYSTNLKTIYASDEYITTNVKIGNNMFADSTNLVGGQGTTYDSTKVDKTYAKIDGGTSSPGYFTLKNN